MGDCSTEACKPPSGYVEDSIEFDDTNEGLRALTADPECDNFCLDEGVVETHCLGVGVVDSGDVDGDTSTKNDDDSTEWSSVCTSGITDMSAMFRLRSRDVIDTSLPHEPQYW